MAKSANYRDEDLPAPFYEDWGLYVRKTLLELPERAEAFNKAFPNYPPVIYSHGWLIGCWYCGRGFQKQQFYGQYPLTFLKRIRALFPDCYDVLHLFSGRVDKHLWETTFDFNPELQPDIVGKVEEIRKHFGDNRFDLVIADPPYEEKDFKIYGAQKFNKRKVLNDCWHICRHYLVWLDLSIPPYRKDMWKLVGTIAIIPGTNARIRVTSIFEKAEEERNEQL